MPDQHQLRFIQARQALDPEIQGMRTNNEHFRAMVFEVSEPLVLTVDCLRPEVAFVPTARTFERDHAVILLQGPYTYRLFEVVRQAVADFTKGMQPPTELVKDDK